MARVTAQDFYDYDKCPHRVYLNRFGDPKEKLPQSDFLNLLFERALDQTRMVRCSGRGAVPALSKKANSVGGQRLWEIFDSCRYPHGKRWTLFLLARINKWDSIAFLIQSLTDQNDSCVELSQRYIEDAGSRSTRYSLRPCHKGQEPSLCGVQRSIGGI